MDTPQNLATRAQEITEVAPAGSLRRRAAGCAAVVLATTRTPDGARRVLQQADLDDAVRDAALELIAILTAGGEPGAR